MTDELPSQIEEILRDVEGKSLLKKEIFEKLKKSYGYEGSERKVERALTSLKEDGVVELVPIQAKRKGKVFTTLGWIHSSAILKKGIEAESDHDKIRLFHTDVIKEKVIRPWIEQLPDIYIDGPYKIFYYKGKNLWQKFGTYDYEKLEVEDELLFEDFKKHVSFYPNPFELLEKLKEKTINELGFVSNQFEEVVNGVVYNHFLKNKRYLKYFPPENRPGRAFFYLMKLKIIDDYLKETPFRLDSEILLEPHYERLYKIFKNKKKNVPSQINKGAYTIEDIQFESWKPQRYNRDMLPEIKSVLDEVVNYCLDPPRECQSAGVEIAKKLVELYIIKKQLVKVLQQHLERNILAGECGYTTP